MPNDSIAVVKFGNSKFTAKCRRIMELDSRVLNTNARKEEDVTQNKLLRMSEVVLRDESSNKDEVGKLQLRSISELVIMFIPS